MCWNSTNTYYQSWGLKHVLIPKSFTNCVPLGRLVKCHNSPSRIWNTISVTGLVGQRRLHSLPMVYFRNTICRSLDFWTIFLLLKGQWRLACSVTSVLADSLRPYGLYPPGSSVPEILQTKILEWVAMPSSRGSSQLRDQTHISCISCIAGAFFSHWATWKAPEAGGSLNKYVEHSH